MRAYVYEPELYVYTWINIIICIPCQSHFYLCLISYYLLLVLFFASLFICLFVFLLLCVCECICFFVFVYLSKFVCIFVCLYHCFFVSLFVCIFCSLARLEKGREVRTYLCVCLTSINHIKEIFLEKCSLRNRPNSSNYWLNYWHSCAE